MSTPGLRERKKQRTRDALTDAGYALFGEKGFEATTVEEIAGAVDISPRTFFRYFASKEDLALAPLNQQLATLLVAVAERPADESVITAVRRAAVEVAEACETGGAGFDEARFAGMQALLAVSPALRAACTEHSTALLDDLTGLVGTRIGVDPAADPRPHLVASVVLCAVGTAVDARRIHRPDVARSQLIGEMFDLLADGLDYPASPAR